MLAYSAILGLVSAFMILLITKLGFRDHAQIYGNKIISEMFSCDLCLSFWMNVVLCPIFLIFVTGDLEMVLWPIVATPITRKMI